MNARERQREEGEKVGREREGEKVGWGKRERERVHVLKIK